jgi:hypothetical protein
VPSLLIPIVLLIGCFGWAVLCWMVWFLQLVSNFAAFFFRFPGGVGCVSFCFTSTESLILAQDERWRRA